MLNLSHALGFKKGQRAHNRKDLSSDLIAEITSLYLSGESLKQLSEKYKITRHVIARNLFDSGVELRSRSQAEEFKWRRMDRKARAKQTRAAHAATRGKKHTFEQRCKVAVGCQKSLAHEGIGENIVAEFFHKQGISFIPQFALDKYNIDFMIGTIAVELNVNSTNPLKRKLDSQKIMDLTSRGMSIVYLCVRTTEQITPYALEQLALVIKILSENPPFCGQYWMIRSYTNPLATALERYDFPFIKTFVTSYNFTDEID